MSTVHSQNDPPRTAAKVKLTLPPQYAGRITLSIDETCEAIGYGRSSLFEVIRRGDPPVIRKGRRTLIAVGSLLDWLAA